MISLLQASRIVKLTETESRIVGTRDWKEGSDEFFLKGYTDFQFGMMKKCWR